MTDDLNELGYFGIDLGTTYSCIARVDRFGRPEVLENLDGQRTTPSVVYFDSETTILVGGSAKEEIAVDPSRGVSLVKRQMGKSDWKFPVFDTEFSAPVISAQILQYLKKSAEQKTGTEVRGVVITVPAYFGATEREATRLAGKEYAGLNVIGIINEPTAAAYYYGFQDAGEAGAEGSRDHTLLVYDLGGGTFDVTVMSVEGGSLIVRATDGDRELGGANWDAELVNLMIRKYLEANPGGPDPGYDMDERAKLALVAEDIKRALTEKDRKAQTIVIQEQGARVEITRAEFEEATQHLLEKTIEKTHAVIEAARERGVTTIDRIILVGGSSKMPAVRERLAREFSVELELRDPDLAVAMGAALIATREGVLREVLGEQAPESGDGSGGAEVGSEQRELSEPEKEAVLDRLLLVGFSPDVAAEIAASTITNVLSQGFGMVVVDKETGEEFVDFLAHRDDQVPLSVERRYGTIADNQTGLTIRVMEQASDSESRPLSSNKDIPGGTGNFEGIPSGYPRGTSIDVRFEVSNEGTITLTARHPGYPGVMTVNATPEGIFSAKEIQRGIEQSTSLVRVD